MTARDLITAIQFAIDDAPDEFGFSLDNVEVRVAHNPLWAMEYEIDAGPDIIVTEVPAERLQEYTPVIYLAATEQLGYLPEEGKETLGW